MTGIGISHAQTPAASSGTLEEIIVTARKVEENLQTTPIAITAFTGTALEERQVFNTNKLGQVVPNLQFSNNAPLAGNNSSSQVFIRGIGQSDPTSTVDPGVGLYIDDVYIGNAVGGSMALRDIGSIQVLRGPQGTLFGRNTMGGAVVITSTQPGDDFGGTVRATVGSDNLIDGFLALDAPLASTLKSRFSVGMRKQDGYVIRSDGKDLGDTNTFTATGKVVWEPNDQLKGSFNMDYTTAEENGSPLVFAAINEAQTFPRAASAAAGCPGFTFASGLPVPMIKDDRCANDLQSRGPYANNGTYPLLSTLDNWGASANVTYALSDVLRLKSVTAYRYLKWRGKRDADNTPLTILHTDFSAKASQFSQELQVVYESQTLTGVGGLYYFTQKSDDIVTVELRPPPGVQQDSDNNKVDNKSWAAFTQWTYKFTDSLSATGGARYTQDNKGQYPDQFNYLNPAIKQIPVQWYRHTFSAFTPSASVSYRWTEKIMTYASYSKGFKGGGWNSHFNAVLTADQQAALHRFNQEEATTYELGFKADLLDSTLRLNGAVFTSDYTDMQITYRGPLPSGVAPFLVNAGKASIDGAELELTWAPTDKLVFDASVGYLDGTIDRLDAKPLLILPPELKVGNQLPFAPEWQAHAGASYDIAASDYVFTPRLDMSYQDTTYFDAGDTPEIAQLDSVTVLNASLVFKPSDGNWRATLNVNNLTDEVYPISGNPSLSASSGYAEVAYARPREYSAAFSYTF